MRQAWVSNTEITGDNFSIIPGRCVTFSFLSGNKLRSKHFVIDRIHERTDKDKVQLMMVLTLFTKSNLVWRDA